MSVFQGSSQPGCWALMLALPAIGFVLLSRHLTSSAASPPLKASTAIGAGAVAGIAFVVLRTIDPLRFWLLGEATWASALSESPANEARSR